MKNQHLIPINIIDIVERLNDSNIRDNERNNYIHRLEVIRDYCDMAIKKAPTRPMFDDLRNRKTRTGK